MNQVRTAAIVGVHWGLVHVRALREAGCEVVALGAADAEHAQSAARREGVPRGTSDIASLDEVDVVVVATPASTHAEVLGQLPSPYLICEKPLLGLDVAPSAMPDVRGRMFVNYAFAFLRTARDAADVVQRLGPPQRVRLEVQVTLPLSFSSQEWFLEAASHPLSWLLHLLGAPEVVSRQVTAEGVTVGLLAGRTPVEVALRVGGEPGITHRFAFRWAGRGMRIEGRYRPGGAWQYDPVLVDGGPVNGGEWSASDCWLDANAASVRMMIEVFRGRSTMDEGLACGLFDASRALWLERIIREGL